MILNISNEEREMVSNIIANPKKFMREIEIYVQRYEISYLEAIMQYCDDNDVEIESVPKLVGNPLKEKLEAEAIELNFLPKTGTLPI